MLEVPSSLFPNNAHYTISTLPEDEPRAATSGEFGSQMSIVDGDHCLLLASIMILVEVRETGRAYRVQYEPEHLYSIKQSKLLDYRRATFETHSTWIAGRFPDLLRPRWGLLERVYKRSSKKGNRLRQCRHIIPKGRVACILALR